jgi:hypothetical protein
VTLWLNREVSDEGVPLAGQDGVSVELSAASAFVAERAMWWPGESASWHEAHASAGFSEAPRSSWRLAGGELSPDAGRGEANVETFVLIANVAPTAETVDVRVYFPDREPVAQTVHVDANSRVSIALSDLLGAAGARPAASVHVGVTIAATSPAALLYAEQATYGSTSSQRWARGSGNKGSH